MIPDVLVISLALTSSLKPKFRTNQYRQTSTKKQTKDNDVCFVYNMQIPLTVKHSDMKLWSKGPHCSKNPLSSRTVSTLSIISFKFLTFTHPGGFRSVAVGGLIGTCSTSITIHCISVTRSWSKARALDYG